MLTLAISLLSSFAIATMWSWITVPNSDVPRIRRYQAVAHQPRIHFLYGEDASVKASRKMQPNLNFPDSKTDDVHDGWQPVDYSRAVCQPMADWQLQSFPTCNLVHEASLLAAMMPMDDDLNVLGRGWFRTTWKLDTAFDSLVLKTLRIEREYKREYYELHRRDAMVMERLTSSPFVVSVFGMCGNSAFNELADFPFPGVQSLEVFNRRMRGQEGPTVSRIKLRMAASVAVGLADIHGIDSNTRASVAHYDLNPRNIALFSGGKPKLNDFNVAELLHINPTTNETCGFLSRLHEPWWRAPEEMNTNKSVSVLIDEKVDVYALGNVLFHTLTTHSPHGKMIASRVDSVRAEVAAGTIPPMMEPYSSSNNTAIVAVREAIAMCYHRDPTQRATAQEVADHLMDAYMKLVDTNPNIPLSPTVAVQPMSNTSEDSSEDGDGVIEDKG